MRVKAAALHANEAACLRDRLMGASRSERSIARRERAVASGSPSPAPARRARSLRRANRRNDGLYAAMHILPAHRDGERKASEGDPEGAFGSPQREPTARDAAKWWRPLGATQCSRSRAVGGVSGAAWGGDLWERPRAAQRERGRSDGFPHPSAGRAGAGPLAGPEHRAGRRGTPWRSQRNPPFRAQRVAHRVPLRVVDESAEAVFQHRVQLLMFTKNWSEWPSLFEHRGH